MKLLVLTIVLTLMVTNGVWAGGLRYSVTDLGIVNGHPSGINDSGQVVGSYGSMSAGMDYGQGYTGTFVWSASTGLVDMGTMAYNGSSGASINNSGTILGTVMSPDCRTYRWSQDTGMTLLPLLSDGVISIPCGINNSGQAVGMSSSSTDGSNGRAVLWDIDGNITALSDTNSTASAINDSGEIVGWSKFAPDQNGHATIWSTNGAIDINPNDSASTALAINSSGQVVGCYSNGLNDWGSFIWSEDEGLFRFSRNGNNGVDGVVGLNDAGLAIGYSLRPVSDRLTLTRACVLPPFADANELPLLPGYNYSSAFSINNRGQIVGVVYEPIPGGSSKNDYTWRSVIWNPVPEPSSLLALGAGLVGLISIRRKRK